MTAQQPVSDVSVRRARPDDSEAVAAITLAWWRAQPDDVVPAAALDAVTVEDLARDWRDAVSAPPSRQHVVLVALDGGEVVGYALAEPSPDPDSDASSCELVELLVRDDRTRRGHGSRLLAAIVDTLRLAGGVELLTWVAAGDDARLAFLAAAGIGPDGASRTLADGLGPATLRQVRCSARID